MQQFKNIVKSSICALLFALGLMGISSIQAGTVAYAATTAKAVSVKTINYEEGYILINQNANEKIYYSDSKQKTWTQLEGPVSTDGCQQMDISWIAVSKDYELTLKGDKDDTVVSVNLPKYNSGLKVKFDAINSILTFTGDYGAESFEWRKAASTDAWSGPVPTDMLNKSNAATIEKFQDEIEMLRAKGGKISVRLPQVLGTSANPGSRPSKVVTVTIPARAAAPAVKVTANTMKVNTTVAMEYCVVYDGLHYTSETEGEWAQCAKNMLISELSSQSPAKDVVIAIRKAETAKAAYSKCAYLEIPHQELAPSSSDVVDTAVSATKFTLSITNASASTPYQYCVVKAANVTSDFNPNTATWKKVTNSKDISFASKTYPAGSVIYVRVMGNDKTNAKALKLPSDYLEVNIDYAAE